MATHADIAQRWADVHAGTAERFLKGSGNVFESDGKLYSYGSHFELARCVKPKRGNAFYLLNGDTYSVTTSSHQAETRSAVNRHGDKLASLIIPHSALNNAGIVLNSIVPIAIEPERYETTKHRVTVPGLVKLAEDAAAGKNGWSDHNASEADKERGTYALAATRTLSIDRDEYRVTAYKRGYDYTAAVECDCGACDGTGAVANDPHGYSGGTAAGRRPCSNPSCTDGKVTSQGGYVEYDPPKVSFCRNGNGLTHIEGDSFEYETSRHFLGAALIRATVRELVTTLVHSGPIGDGTYQSAEHEGRYWRSVHSGRDGKVQVHYRNEVRRNRTAYFLSAFDLNESHPHYFLCELPDKVELAHDWTRLHRPTTVEDAVYCLAPLAVRKAQVAGEAVLRQGDIFAVPCSDLPAPIAFRHPEAKASVPLDGSGRHMVSELVTVKSLNGRSVRYFARGRMWHDSAPTRWNGRRGRPEHKAITLDGWHELHRNTVPLSRPNVTAGSFTRTRQPRAWSIIGNVD